MTFIRFIIITIVIYLLLTFIKWILFLIKKHSYDSSYSKWRNPSKSKEEYKDVKDAKFIDLKDEKKNNNVSKDL